MQIELTETIKKSQIVSILERICLALELTSSQHELAKSRYETVGDWLGGSDNALLEAVTIYPQGSVALGTTVRPLTREEHDVDLICSVARLGPDLPPAALKHAIGERLRENGHYEILLEEMPRCWRLNYANEFHLDITPSIKNPSCPAGGELVPDKRLRQWKPSNPRGYQRWFDARARLQPRMRLAKAALAEGERAELQPFPATTGMKGFLRRTVQLAKRHRDIHFAKLDDSLRPISIVITTLAAKSYAHCASALEFDNELDVLREVVRLMPVFIEERQIQGRKQWFIWNETTAGENFAEKWNTDPSRAEAFFEWHARATSELDRMVEITGLDGLTKSLKESFGEAPVSKVMREATEAYSNARREGRLSVVPAVGLSIGTGLGSSVRQNTFFGGA
jgi:Second Messenger Oligonucleotide or Dinucleotide Synthetase domain